MSLDSTLTIMRFDIMRASNMRLDSVFTNMNPMRWP